MITPRLTEAEVHEACAEIAAQGERPTALILLDRLGRGSLTTITKYLNSWYASDAAQSLEAETLPVVVNLPQELSKDGEDLLKKIWNVAKGIADKELEVQREALRQAEKDAQARVEESFAFSEAQALKIDRLEEDFRSIKAQLDEKHLAYLETQSLLAEAEKANVGLSKDKDQLAYEVETLKKQVAGLEDANKAALADQQQLQKDHAVLKTEAKGRETELSKRLAEIEKLREKIELVQTELASAKTELQSANKAVSEAEKQVANLEGRLAVYKSLDRTATDGAAGSATKKNPA